MRKYVVAGAVIFATFGSSFAQQPHPAVAKIDEGILQINTVRANACKGAVEKACLERSGKILREVQAIKARVEEFLRKPFDPQERAAISVELKRLDKELIDLLTTFPLRDVRLGAN